MSAESGPQIRSRLRGHPAWGPRVLFGLLAALAAAEGARLVVTGHNAEARTGGWYLVVVVLALLCGVLGRAAPPSAGDRTGESAEESTGESAAPSPREGEAGQSTAGRRRTGVLAMFAAAVGYAWALPWFGFAAVNFLFLAAYLRWVARRSRRRSLLYALICDAVFVAGFDLLSVQVPDGVFGIGL